MDTYSIIKKEPLLKLNVFKVKAFAEKPHLTLAKRFFKKWRFSMEWWDVCLESRYFYGRNEEAYA